LLDRLRKSVIELNRCAVGIVSTAEGLWQALD